ncbi:hypothetical protein [Deinococcus hopiensis]|uniref:hypothetical protein n=1 Tax=Deinococcus hopiensis TaxID=309885 RepID=UPI000A00F012|nr:hypothetical protein [Deinococcus hopiensis]
MPDEASRGLLREALPLSAPNAPLLNRGGRRCGDGRPPYARAARGQALTAQTVQDKLAVTQWRVEPFPGL